MNASTSQRDGRGDSDGPGGIGLTSAQRDDLARAKRTGLWVGLLAPLVVITAALVLVLVWMPRMPNPAATHWGGSGGPDGFGSPWSYVWLLALVGYGIVLMMWGIVEFSSRTPPPASERVLPVWSGVQRFLVAFSLGYAAFLSAVLLGSVIVQLDLKDPAQATGLGATMSIGFGAWVFLTATGWFVQPGIEVRPNVERAVEPILLSTTERAVWFGVVRPSSTFIWIILVVVVIMMGAWLLVFFMPADEGDGMAKNIATIATGGVTLLIVLLLAMTTWFRVRIDARGLEARSALGWPVFRLPAADVQRVETAQINPLGEFGGWGLRWMPGRFGIVMRSGEGIIATRSDGRIFAITVDDSEAAAAVLAAVAKGAQK